MNKNDLEANPLQNSFAKCDKYKNGLQSGIRIVSMNRNDLEANPLQNSFAKCDKRSNDFPQSVQQSNNRMIDI